MKGFNAGGLNLEEREQMDRLMHDLIEIVQFAESVSAKIHGLLDEAEIYRTVKAEFVKSRKYTVSILLLTDDGSKLRFAETSLSPAEVKAGEKAVGLRLKGYKIDLNKSSIYSRVVREGKTVQANVSDVIGELFPQPLAYLISKIMGYMKKPSILTPLKQHGKIIGALAMSSTSLAEHLIPSVRNLAQHISNALELAEEHARRKKVEEELWKQQKRLQNILDSVPAYIFLKDEKGRHILVNKALADVTGIPQEKWIGKTIFELLPNLADRYHKDDMEVIASGKPKRNIIEPFETPGGIRWTQTEKIPYKDEEGHVVGVLASAVDITKRRVAEEALRESEERLRQLIEYAPDAIYMNDLKGNFIDGNKQAENLIGYKKDELIGKNFLKIGLLPPRYVPKAAQALTKNLLGRKTGPDEYELIRKDGRCVTVEISTFPVKRSGKIEVIGIARDITERKEMEEKLRRYYEHLEELVQKRTDELLESEKRYSVVVEEASDGVLIAQDEKVVFVNKKAAEIVGYSRDELTGLPFEKLLDEKYRQLVKTRYERRIRGEKFPATIETELIAKTGERVQVEVSTTLIHYQGRPADLAILRDIRERKRLEEERSKLEKLATIGELATMVGHDLRNPLQSIENATYYLKHEITNLSASVPISPKTTEMLQVINNSINYADKIIRDLQDFSATKAPKLEKTDINAIVKETLSQILIPKNVELRTGLNYLPEIDVDKDQIKRVFLNLAVNGIQAMENGGTLTVSTKKTENFVEVSFKDTGVGIPKENMEKLFTPFFTTRAKGIGMGLPICKKFIENHGGSIEVESEVSKGTTFTVKLHITKENGVENH